jgi:hypothetical protein
MKAVYQAENLLDAHLIKGALENQGIPAFVAGEHLIGGIGQLRSFLAVMVDDHQAPQALALIDELRGATGPLAADDGASDASIKGDFVPQPS